MSKAALNVIYGLAATFTLFSICILIRPAGLAANDGLSYFGTFKTTIIPYSLAFLVDAYFYLKTAAYIKVDIPTFKYLTMSLQIMAVLLVGLLLTPHTLFDSIHTMFGATLFSLQFLLSIWLLLKDHFDWQNIALFILEFLSGLAAFYYLPKPNGLLLQTQLIFQLAFGAMLVRALNRKSVLPVVKSEVKS